MKKGYFMLLAIVLILIIIALVLLFGAMVVRELLAVGCGLLCFCFLLLFFFAMCRSDPEPKTQEVKRKYNTIDEKYNGLTAEELQNKFIEEDKARRLEKESKGSR